MRHAKKKVYRLALFTDRVSLLSRRVFEGMLRYAQDHSRVQVASWKTSNLTDARLIESAQFDGILFETLIDHDHSVLPRGVPALTLSSALEKSPVPRLCDDQQWAGTTAARYLMSRGWRSFAYCGYAFHHGAAERGKGFRVELSSSGHRCADFEFSSSETQEVAYNSLQEQERLARWLRSLPQPCALFAFCDAVALTVIQVAQRSGLQIPKNLAVLGVDNDPFLQSALPLRLSSINLGTVQTGYKAAAAVMRWITTGKKPPREARFRSARVVVRETTDHHYVDDELVAGAIELIEATTGQPVVFSEMAAHLGCSSRTLQRRFSEKLGLSIGEIAQRIRLEKAQRQLAESEVPLKVIAEHCGFSSSQHLCTAFRSRLGITPRAWRESQRASEL